MYLPPPSRLSLLHGFIVLAAHPESAGGMNLTFGVEIVQKRDLQFIYTPKKAEFADSFPFMVCE